MRHPLPFVAAVGVLLFLPSLGGGFLADDAYHLAAMENPEMFSGLGPLSLYTFIDDQPDRMGPVHGDLLPWWASSDFRQDFFRPLSCVFHQIDHVIYGRNPVGYHATNLLLWAFVLVMVLLLYRELAGNWKRGPLLVLLAGLFFALDEAHVLTVCWVANRYALLGTALSLGAVLQYHRYRNKDGMGYLFWSLLLTGLALLADEGSVSLLFWLVAYEVCLSKDRIKKRIGAAAPAAAMILVYMAVYTLLGYGSSGSENYINPLQRPMFFLKEAVAERIPFLLMGALTPVPAQLSISRLSSDGLEPLILAWGLSAVMVVLLACRLRKDRVAGFMALAALGVMITRATTYPHDRLLLLATAGSAWVLAAFVAAAWRSGWFWRIAAVAVVGIHGLVAPVQTGKGVVANTRRAEAMRRAALESDLPGAGQAEGARVLLLSSPPYGYFFPGLRWLEGLPYPEAVWVVTMGRGDFRLSCTGPNSFRVEILTHDFLRELAARICRDEFVFEEGDRFKKGALEVVITRVKEEQVREFVVSIDRPLDHPRVWLVAWNGSRFVRMPPPP